MLASQAVFGAALAWVLPGWVAALSALCGFGVLVRRARTIWSDPPRSVWVTRLVDAPVFLHVGASVGALALLPAAATVVFLLSLGGVAPASGTLAAAASYGAGALLSAFALSFGRLRVRVREIEVEIPGLPSVFEGYRIAHLSDLHIGSFDRLARGLEWTEKANRLAPDLAVCTGDLVTSGTHHYADAARVVGSLRARDGTLAVLGNHDQWAPDRFVRLLTEQGVKVLSNDWVRVERDGAALVVAGLDDRFAGRDDIDRTLAGRPAQAKTILLSHYPSFFEEAAARGVDLVLAGHTHNGQIGLPLVGDRWNLARLTGQALRGLSRSGRTQMYVSAGLGTSGPPLRLGVPPEIALIVLRSEAAPL